MKQYIIESFFVFVSYCFFAGSTLLFILNSFRWYDTTKERYLINAIAFLFAAILNGIITLYIGKRAEERAK